MANGMLTTGKNMPIKLYHGCSEPIDASSKVQHLYVTPSPNYKHIKQSKYIYELEAEIFKPFFTENQSLIESLRSFPEKIKMLTDLGFDAVIYSSRKNITKGASGWGNDQAQYLLLSARECVSNMRHISERSQLEMTYVEDSVISGPLYHSTSENFAQFEHTKSGDVGFHFGTKSAAKDRAKNIGTRIECKISKISASSSDIFAKGIHDNTLPASIHIPVLELLFNKLYNIKDNLIDQIQSMSLDELVEVTEEFINKPNTGNYEKMLFRANNANKYLVESGQNEPIIVNSKNDAVAYKNFITDMAMKKAYLTINNPLHIPDLGTWKPENILREIPTTQEQRDKFYTIENDSGRFEFLREVVMSLGYDGFSYTNQVEDIGTTSYIALSTKSIRVEPPRLPEFISMTRETAPSITQEKKTPKM